MRCATHDDERKSQRRRYVRWTAGLAAEDEMNECKMRALAGLCDLQAGNV